MRKLKVNELGRKTIEEFKASGKNNYIIILDNVRSLNNIGSIFRTADAFLAEAIYLCGICAKPPHRDIHKTALGATESVDWRYFPSTIDAVNELKSREYIIVSVEQVDRPVLLQDFSPDKNKKYAFIFGHEVKGVSDEVIKLSDFCVEIPQAGTKHSLNIAVSAGIIMWKAYETMNGSC